MKNSIIFLLTFLSITLIKCDLFCQSISMEVIGSNGMFVSSNSGSMVWTIGEVTIDTYSSSVNFLTQGFHQPERIEPFIITEFFIPDGFSPNGDGINDLFVIRGIEMYPQNSIAIYNRWGNIVYKASPYQNKWDGRSIFGLIIDGDELPVSTYFYLFDFGNGMKIIKGTIYLNR